MIEGATNCTARDAGSSASTPRGTGSGSVIYEHAHEVITGDVFLSLDGLLPKGNAYLKLEGLNPAGSIKLKTALGLISDLEFGGHLKPGSRLIESSSGNLGVALSMICAAKGYRFTCVTDPLTSEHNLILMRAAGAQVVQVDERDESGGYLGTRIRCIKAYLEEDPELIWTNQYANTAGPRMHADRTAQEILREFDSVEYLFVGTGTTGTLMGCLDRFRKQSPHTRVIAVDAYGSVTFGFPPARRHLPGLGTSRRPGLRDLDENHPDEVIRVKEADAIRACRRLATHRGVFVGASTGAVVAAMLQRKQDFPTDATLVAVSPDMGDRYARTVYDDDWVLQNYGADIVTGANLPGAETIRDGRG
ncbi:2,3-diaminopropionate biosynthesis protein SbnA [Kitasatospora sp. NPDC101183]|uniref:2,3-diaminopropionate biosynthesis protein SbnA n=1 Tax=Kitasatospora sp. NPDC101183 TaxID=3364100 RepID=UPI0037FC6A49